MGTKDVNDLRKAISDVEKIFTNMIYHKEDIIYLRRETLRTGDSKLLKKLIRREKGLSYFKRLLNERLNTIRILA